MAVENKKNTKIAIPYLLPAAIAIFIFTVLPILYTIFISFTDYCGDNRLNGNWKFIGIDNFLQIFNGKFSSSLFPVFLWTVVFALLSTGGSFLVGLIAALLLNNENVKERAIYKAILILPWALPVTVAILSWKGLLHGSEGAINNILVSLGIMSDGNRILWLEDPFFARMWLILVNIWLGFPYMMNICLGALASIPKDYYEAADVDGANKLIQFVKITLPSLANTAYPLLISSFSFNFNNFGSAYLITNGNPAGESVYAGKTDILASVIYKFAVKKELYATGAALGIIVFVILAVISYAQMKLSGQFEEVK